MLVKLEGRCVTWKILYGVKEGKDHLGRRTVTPQIVAKDDLFGLELTSNNLDKLKLRCVEVVDECLSKLTARNELKKFMDENKLTISPKQFKQMSSLLNQKNCRPAFTFFIQPIFCEKTVFCDEN